MFYFWNCRTFFDAKDGFFGSYSAKEFFFEFSADVLELDLSKFFPLKNHTFLKEFE